MNGKIAKALSNRWIRWSNLFRALWSKKIILVYQMGKVGSTSIYDVARSKSGLPVFQLHRFRLIPGTFVDRGFVRTFFRKVWADLLFFVIKNKELKIISLTREPVSRNISDFFQTLDFYINVNGLDKKSLSASNLIEIFFNQYPHFSSIGWFDEQVKKVFGIDVYEFPFSNNVLLVKKNNVELLVVRMEDLLEKVNDVGEFIGAPDFEIIKTNDGGAKWYSDVYRDFKSEISLSSYQGFMKSTMYSKHFYPEV